jgi:hypothetical protein
MLQTRLGRERRKFHVANQKESQFYPHAEARSILRVIHAEIGVLIIEGGEMKSEGKTYLWRLEGGGGKERKKLRKSGGGARRSSRRAVHGPSEFP